jgi:adenylosuccinate synthase
MSSWNSPSGCGRCVLDVTGRSSGCGRGRQRHVRRRAGRHARRRCRHLSVRHLIQHHRRRRRDRHRHRALRFDHVLGIVKAYTTRVGAGPFPTELFDDLRRASVARRARVRLGDRPSPALRLVRRRGAAPLDHALERLRSVHDQARRARRPRDHPHLRRLPGARSRCCPGRRCSPMPMPTSSRSTRRCRAGKTAPSGCANSRHCRCKAQRYLERIQQLVEVPLDLVSTGPDRDQTIVLRQPFDA